MSTDENARRTKRRYAHELYPHAKEFEIRPLAVEVPYLYARALGFETYETSWMESSTPDVVERSSARTMLLVEARRTASLADALAQGLTGDEAWAWAEERAGDYSGEIVYDRAVHYGVPVDLIKPYPCGPEPSTHDHMASTGDVTGYGLVTSVDCPESECDVCTEPVPAEEAGR